MNQAHDPTRLSQYAPASLPQRRTLLRGSLGALAAIALGRGLAACSDAADASARVQDEEPSAKSASERDERLADGARTSERHRSHDAASEPGHTDDAGSQRSGGEGGSGERSRSEDVQATTGRAVGDASAPSAMPTRIDCPRPTTFAPIVDDAPRASFRRTKESTTLDWITIAAAMSGHLSRLPERVLTLLSSLSALKLGHPVDMLAHSLQTATRAQRAGAADELVLIALCHRLGMAFTIEGYAELSASILRGYVSDAAYRIVRHYPEYAAQRLPTSSALGGGELRARYLAEPWHADATRFCDAWASLSYDPDYDAKPLAEFEPLVRAAFGVGLGDPYKTRGDCISGARP